MYLIKALIRHYINPEQAKKARQRDKEVTRILKDHHKQELKKLKILLLGKCNYI
jgi:hypothetical protein